MVLLPSPRQGDCILRTFANVPDGHGRGDTGGVEVHVDPGIEQACTASLTRHTRVPAPVGSMASGRSINRSVAITLAPSELKARAMARPIPEPATVTMISLSENRRVFSSRVLKGGLAGTAVTVDVAAHRLFYQ